MISDPVHTNVVLYGLLDVMTCLNTDKLEWIFTQPVWDKSYDVIKGKDLDKLRNRKNLY